MSIPDRLITPSSDDTPQNLWNKALDTLSIELRATLDSAKASHGDVLRQALREAQKKKQLCVQKSWTLKKRNGEMIILRDVVEKIVVWVEKFIAVGDIAVQYDPVHAAPAWAAFRFVLQIAVNDRRALGETIENLEAVSHLITRYAILEELYLQRNSATRDQLEANVVRLYAEVLTYLAKARKYFQSSVKVRLALSIVKFSEDEQMAKIRVLDDQISKLVEVLNVDIQTDTAKEVASMSAFLTSLSEPIKRLVDHSYICTRSIEENQHLELLNWLSSVPFSSHHKRHSQSRIPGSGQWLMDHNRYLDWRNTSSSSIFLLHGIIGSGKTSLASAVVDSFFHESFGQASPAPIAYFYCTRNAAEAERSNPEEILRSILRQLTVSHEPSPTVHERVLQEFERRQAVAKVDGFEVTKLQAAECTRLILDTTAANPATIVVDAVDEIQPNSRHTLLSALAQIVQDSSNVVKIFITSRDDSNIYALLPHAVALRIQHGLTRKDMNDFVHREILAAIQNQRMLNGMVSEKLKQDLLSALVAGAGEMFIWVLRQMENLCRMKTEADIRDVMPILPKHTLDHLYAEDFTRMSHMGQHTWGYAVQVFSTLLSTQEALSPQALIQTIQNPKSQQGDTLTLAKLIDICSNLIILDDHLNVLRFAHMSFQEFLEMRAEFAPHHVHSVVAINCLEFCLQGLPIGMETNSSPKDDFYHYSAIYWAEHCKLTLAVGVDQHVVSKMNEFVFDDGDVSLAFVDWVQEVNNFAKKLPNDHLLAKELHSVMNSRGSPLFTACVFGLDPIVGGLARTKDHDWNQTNDLGQSGLYLAAAAGHRSTVQRFLQHEVNVNTLGGKLDHPLHAACFGGHASVVELLLEHGADPKLGPRSALECALLADREAIALMLLNGNFKVANQAECDSLLQKAAEAGFADVVQFLQKEYASLQGNLGSSRYRAVDVAIFKGRIGVVERYMQRLSDPELGIPGDAVATAALGGQDTMINFLVDKGLDLDREGLLGTPLRAASLMGQESTVRLLLKLGANLHASGSLGGPLQAAAMRGHSSITKTLLKYGADVNGKGGLYGTALQAAAYHGHRKIVEILLDAGADVYRDGFSRDAFHAASEGGHEGIVRLFLKRGFTTQRTLPGPFSCYPAADPNKDLLREASPSRLLEMKTTRDHQLQSKDWRERAFVVEYSDVLKNVRGAVDLEPDSIQRSYRERPWYGSDHEENYALRAAAAKGHVAVIKLLLSQLDRLEISKSEIAAAFNEACENGHAKVVDQMLSGHVEVWALKAAFETAALNGHLSVVNLLVDHEDRHGLARVETVESPTQGTYECDSTARRILDSGSKRGHLPMLRRGQDLLAQRCTDVASRHLHGEALITAAANRNSDVMEALLESNHDFHLEELANTLISVCAWGSRETLRTFLKHDTAKILTIQLFSRGLVEAAWKNNLQVVSYWLEEHPEHLSLILNPTTVIEVSGKGFVSVLPSLIKHIKPTASFEKTLSQCLQVASSKGHGDVVEYLVGEGADANAVSKELVCTGGGDSDFSYHEGIRKLSPLQAALIGFERFDPEISFEHLHFGRSNGIEADASSQSRSVEILLAKGANPDGAEGYERYPLIIAAEFGTIDIVQRLISSGASAGRATKEYGTALEAAARREVGGFPIVKALLEATPPVRSSDFCKAAALKEALSFFKESKGRFKHSDSLTDVLCTGPGAVVKTLLADLPKEKAYDSRYGLLAQMACVAGDQKCIELLLQHDMDVNILGNYYGTALQAASRVGNIVIVQLLLDSGANVNFLQGVHSTALRAAALGGHDDLVRILIARGADVNLRYEDRDESILHLALKAGNPGTFKDLLDAGAETNTATLDRQHILITACEQGDLTFVKLLLASGVDVNVSGTKPRHYQSMPDENATPLIAACTKGHFSVIQLLLDHGADIEKIVGSSATPLIAAIHRNNLLNIRLLLNAGANVNKAVKNTDFHTPPVFRTPLSEAAENCKLEIVEELLSVGAIIAGPSTNTNALARACRRSRHKVVAMLLEAMSGTQYKVEIFYEAFSEAIESSDDETVCLLLERLASPSFDMLRQACAAGKLEAVKLLVDNGMDVNEGDDDDAPLLHVAASHSRPDVVQFLIDQGASAMLRSMKYGSPLIAALEASMAYSLRSYSQSEACRSLAEQLPRPRVVWTGRQDKPGYLEVLKCEQIVQSLFYAGAEMDTTIRDFGNALHLAAYMGSETIVCQILERMKDVNIFGGYFESPLIAALKGDHPTIVKLLLDRGIDVNRSSLEHGPALYYACAHRSKEMIQNLLDYGADVNAYDDRHGSALAAAASRNENDGFDHNNSRSAEEQQAIVDLLLRHESRVQIRECDLLAAASWFNLRKGQHLMNLFFKHDRSAVATEGVIIKAMQHYRLSNEALTLLLRHDGGLGTTAAMLKNAKNFKIMETLLNHKPLCQVTADVVESATTWHTYDSKLVELLLAHDPEIPVTEAAIIGAIGCDYAQEDSYVLELLLDRIPEKKVTDEMLQAAKTPKIMGMLLQRRSKEQMISPQTLEAVTFRCSEGARVVQQLLKHDTSVKITPSLIWRAITSDSDEASLMRAFFEHDPSLAITQENFMTLVNEMSNKKEMRNLYPRSEIEEIPSILLEYGKTVVFTDEIREAIDKSFQSESDKETRELLYRLEKRHV